MRWTASLLLFVFACCLASACSEKGSSDSETHWESAGLSCESDAECDDALSCLCGVCTTECSSGADTCAGVDEAAECVAAAEGLPDRCTSPAPDPGVCLRTCSTVSDCVGRDVMLDCVDGYCVNSDEPTTDPQPTQPPADGVFHSFDGPPGITVDVNVGGTLYGHASADGWSDAPAITWRSDDAGQSWQPLGDSGADAALAAQSTAAYAATADYRVLGTGDGLYRAPVGSDQFTPLSNDLPGALVDLAATDQVLLARATVDGSDAMYRSLDGGQSWSALSTNRPGVQGFAVWGDKIFVNTFADFELSEDGGDTFRAVPVPPGGLPDPDVWWASDDAALYIYYLDSAGGEYRLARSTDGESWTDLSVTNPVQSNPAAMVADQDTVYAVSQDGVLFSVPKDGGQVTRVVDPSQSTGVVSKVFAIGDSLVLSGTAGTVLWSPGQSRYEVADAGMGYVEQLEAVNGQVWAKSASSLFRYVQASWRDEAAPADSHGWRDARLFEVDGALYAADSSDCLFRREGGSAGQWELLLQWTTAGVQPGCANSTGAQGDIAAVIDFDGATYIGQSGHYYTPSHNAGSTRASEGGLVRLEGSAQSSQQVQPAGVSLPHAPHIAQMSADAGALFVDASYLNSSGDITRHIYRIGPHGWQEVSGQVSEDGEAVADARAASLLATDAGVYALVHIGDDAQTAQHRYARWDDDSASFRLLPALPGEDAAAPSAPSAGAHTLYVGADTHVYRLDDGDWQRVGGGLPDDRGPITALEVDGVQLYVAIQRGGVWQLVPSQ